MAYFSNGTDGMVFDEECLSCKYGQKACPIALVQMEHNYSACNNKEARKILDSLVSNQGTCAMKQEFKEDFAIDPDQISLFS